jgi:hypothetical protein
MDGRLVFFNRMTRLLEEELSGSGSESMHIINSLHLTLTRSGSPGRNLAVNFMGDTAFIHIDEKGGVKGPFRYSDDGKTLTRSKDEKQFTPEEIVIDVLADLRA